MNKRIQELLIEAGFTNAYADPKEGFELVFVDEEHTTECVAKLAELIVREMCGIMEQAEDDAYHCFDPSERPTDHIEWLREWQERFMKHFGVEE